MLKSNFSLDEFTDISLAYTMWQGPQPGVLFNSGKKKRHHRHRDEIFVSPVVDWPYRLAYVNASIEDMAPTHRQQYLMVKSMKMHEDFLSIKQRCEYEIF